METQRVTSASQKLLEIEKSLALAKKHVGEAEKGLEELRVALEEENETKVYTKITYLRENDFQKARRTASFGYIQDQNLIKKSWIFESLIAESIEENLSLFYDLFKNITEKVDH